MATPSFGELYGTYIQDEAVLAALGNARLLKVAMSGDKRHMTVLIRPEGPVDPAALQQAGARVGEAFGLGVSVLPRYPAESFSEEYFPLLVELLRQRHAAVNGSFEGAGCAIEGDVLTVTLTHGGRNTLTAMGVQRLLQELIGEVFDRRVRVELANSLAEVHTTAHLGDTALRNCSRFVSFLPWYGTFRKRH